MTKDLQQLRKEAGFKTGKDFATECGISPSTYARYEKDPSGIPLKSAWKIADALGCGIDAIVGRENPSAADERGDVQKRYDALSPATRALVDGFLGYAESVDASEAERARQLRGNRYEQAFRRYQELFFAELEREPGDLLFLGTGDELRARFGEFIAAKVEASSMGADERKEVTEGIMEAYDAFNATDGRECALAYLRL